MKILVLNSGSSSLKYQLFDMDTEAVLCKGLADRIGIEWSKIKHETPAGWKSEHELTLKTHWDALEHILKFLIDEKIGCIDSLVEIDAIGHRVVHGGELYSDSVLIDDAVIEHLKELCDLAPLHNPANIVGIEACRELLGDIPNVAVFDTAFHATMEPEAFLYAIPKEYYEKYAVRRYGFHGTSHKFVSTRAAEILGKDIKNLKLITCHVGNGASITAIDGGKVIDTSMGFTPLEGLVMGTRSGNIDPAIVTYIQQKENLSPAAMDNMLNKKGGVLGISGISSDMRDIEDEAILKNPDAELALNIYVRRIVRYIGSYLAVLGHVDAIVLTAGVLENSAYIRDRIANRLGFLGIKLDVVANDFRGKERIISTPDSKTVLMVIPTNEELVIARDTKKLVK